MRPSPPYEDWLSGRRKVRVPQQFSERTMGRLPHDGEPATPTQLERVLASRRLRIAFSVAALVVGLSRFFYLAFQAQLIAF